LITDPHVLQPMGPFKEEAQGIGAPSNVVQAVGRN